MNENEWIREFPAAVTVCDEEGIILEMNDKSAKIFEKDGGRKLIASNMLDCHPETCARKDRTFARCTREERVYHRKERRKEVDLYRTRSQIPLF